MHYNAANEMNIDDIPNDILNAPISQDEIKHAVRQLISVVKHVVYWF